MITLFAGAASSTTLTPADTLLVEFTTNPANFGGAPPNVLVLGLGSNSTAVGPVFNLTANLYDGISLLGTYSFSSTEFNSRKPWSHAQFKATGSPWAGNGQPVVEIDFSSILAGTINGRLEVTIDAGQVTGLDLSGCNAGCGFDPVNLILWEALTPDGTGGNWDWRTFTASVSAVPEPATVLLVLPALVMLRLRRRIG